MHIVAVLSEIRDHPLLGKADAAVVGSSGLNLCLDLLFTGNITIPNLFIPH